MYKILLMSVTFLMAQEPVSFSGESEDFELDGIPPVVEWVSPQSDEYFDSGETITVSWDAEDDSFPFAPIEISLIAAGGEILSQWSNVENTGSTELTLPDITFTDASFSISATDTYSNTTGDNSDGNIHIGYIDPVSFSGESEDFELDGIPPVVELMSPNGGEEFIIGESIAVNWTASDETLDENSLSIAFSSGTGYTTLSDNLFNDGTETVNLPEELSNTASLQISAVDSYGNTGVDESDGFFSLIPIPDIIFSGLSPDFILDSIDPILSWLFPNGGEVLEANWPAPVSWSASDDSFGDTPIDIQYSALDLGITNEILAEDIENSGGLEITLPNISSDEVMFHIHAVDEFGNSSSDDSDEANAIHYFGCTDSEADNYDSNAEIDDGSCSYYFERGLHSGANLVSFYILPELPCTPLADVLPCGVTGVIWEGVAASQISCGDWVGSLSEICDNAGYWIKTDEDMMIEFTGIPVGVVTYELHEGANLISFPVEGSIGLSDGIPDDVEPMFTGVIGEGIASTQIEPYTWVGSLINWEGGKGYWAKVTEDLSFSFEIDGFTRVTDDTEPSSLIPEPWTYNQSTEQAFYCIEDVQIDGLQAANFWLLAYCGETLVGAREWTGAYTDVPAMGTDSYDETAGYCEADDVPQFYLLQNGDLIPLEGEIPAWQENEIFIISLLGSTIEVPTEFVLKPAYPNPFNPVTTFEYGLPNATNVSLVVYDISGRVISELVNGELDAGYHSVQWNAFAFSSGIYFVQLQTQEFSTVRKLLLLK